MTVPSGTLITTGGSALVGMREDLSDVITMIDPEETPFYSWAGRGEANSSTAHDWQTMALRSPASNAQAEGQTYAATTAKRTTRLTNVCQIATEVATVSGTTNAVDKAGRANELDYQVLIKGYELRRDVEYALVGNVVKSTTDPRTLGGLMTYAGVQDNGSGATDSTANGATAIVPGTARDISIDLVDGLLSTGWQAGSRLSMMMVGPAEKLNFDALASSANLAENQVAIDSIAARDDRPMIPGADWIHTVAVYHSAFGEVRIMINQWMSTSAMFLLDERGTMKPKVCALPGRNFFRDDIAITGDNRSAGLVWEGTLEVPAPKGVAVLTALN